MNGPINQETLSTLVCLRGLNKNYGHFTAVDHIDLNIRRGEFLTFLGSSGSGKTTTLSMIAGFEKPTSGEILLNDRSLIDIPSHKRGIGMVFQHYSLFPHMTVRDNIGFPLDIRKTPKAERNKKVDEILNLVQLEAFAERKPALLSGGQKQRVAIARALVYEPEILLMDEPLGALDKKLREGLQDELRQLHKRLGITMIYVTHDQEEAMRLSERIAIFKEGKIVGLGTGKALYRKPPTAFVASFLGNSNFLKIQVHHLSQARFEEVELTLDPSCDAPVGQEALLMIRPENVDILTTEQTVAHPLPKGFNQIAGTIDEIVFLGESLTCTLTTKSGASVTSKSLAADMNRLSAGQQVWFRWDSRQSCLYCEWEEKDIEKS
jgi:putative spermidine/putrescine transport system ATP-binding protein